MSIKAVTMTAALAATTAFAATPAIGVVSALGNFKVNNASVNGNSSVYSGSQIATGNDSSQILLQRGSSIMLGRNSGATIYDDRIVLSQGGLRIDNLDKTNVQALGYRVAAEEPGSEAAIRLNEGAMEVASISGMVKVFDQNGAMLTRVGAGTASSFKPGQTGAGGSNGKGGNATGAVSGSGGSHVLLYTLVLAGLGGAAYGAVALVNNSNSSSR